MNNDKRNKLGHEEKAEEVISHYEKKVNSDGVEHLVPVTRPVKPVHAPMVEPPLEVTDPRDQDPDHQPDTHGAEVEEAENEQMPAARPAVKRKPRVEREED